MDQMTEVITAPAVEGQNKPTIETVIDAAVKVDAKAEVKPETVEAPKEEKKDPDSQRFAALAKQQRTLFKKDQELKAREAALSEKQSKLAEWEQAKSEAITNPLKVITSLGLTYQQLTDFILNGEKPTPDSEVKQVRTEVEKLRQEREEEKKLARDDAEKASKAEYDNSVKEFHENVAAFVTENKDTYELINLFETNNLVIATIEQHYNNTCERDDDGKVIKAGKVMSFKESADLVEKYLEDQVEKTKATKKYQAKETPQPKGDIKSPTVAQPRTLTNHMTASSTATSRPLSREERIERARAIGRTN